MKLWLLLLVGLIGFQSIARTSANNLEDSADDDFAEFDFDEDSEGSEPSKAQNNQKEIIEDDFDDEEDEFVNEPVPQKKSVVEDDDLEDAVVEDVDSEFNHLLDEEEFEGFNTEEEEEDEFEHMSTKGRGAKEKVKPKPGSQPQTL